MKVVSSNPSTTYWMDNGYINLLEKTKINEKEAVDGPFKRKYSVFPIQLNNILSVTVVEGLFPLTQESTLHVMIILYKLNILKLFIKV